VNKADKPGADRLAMELESVQHLGTDQRHIPIVRTVATATKKALKIWWMQLKNTPHAAIQRRNQGARGSTTYQTVFQLATNPLIQPLEPSSTHGERVYPSPRGIVSRATAPADAAQSWLMG
jgi:putative protein kinase ArgK-like GTPase of G3E family